MAILIPSKNIYNIENQKVRENFIDNVQYKENAISTKEESNVEVYNKGFERTTLANQDKTKYFYIGTPINIPSSGYKYIGGSKQNSYIGAVYCEYKDCYRSMIEALIQKSLKDGHISYIDFENTNDEIVNIEFTGIVNKIDCSVELQWHNTSSGGAFNPLYSSLSVDTSKVLEEQPILDAYNQGGVEEVIRQGYNVQKYSIPKELSASFSSTNTNASGSLKTVFPSLFYTIQGKYDTDEYFYRAIEFLSKCNTITASGEIYYNSTSDTFVKKSINGTYTQYIPLTATISINGTKIVLDVSSQEKTIGSGNSPFSLQENELMQESAYKKTNAIFKITQKMVAGDYRKLYYTVQEIDGDFYGYKGALIYLQGDNTVSYSLSNDVYGDFINVPSSIYSQFNVGDTINVFQKNLQTKTIAEKIISQYSNGKETATILCDINEYYNYDTSQPNNKGTLAISIKSATKPMFEIDDIVIPMVFGANGKDSPMAKYSNGEAKQFRVVGIRPYYDGAVWQELTLLEV